jgi:hypothetical protein
VNKTDALGTYSERPSRHGKILLTGSEPGLNTVLTQPSLGHMDMYLSCSAYNAITGDVTPGMNLERRVGWSGAGRHTVDRAKRQVIAAWNRRNGINRRAGVSPLKDNACCSSQHMNIAC